MEELKLSDDVFEQIKSFDHQYLNNEQKFLIDKLILNEELKKRYKEHGLCKECKQPNTSGNYSNEYWCQSCNVKHFQHNFKNWTSGNHDIDEVIQNAQLNAKNYEEDLEWIDYDRFENVEYLAKGGFGTTYKAIWKDGYIRCWDSENHQWKRFKDYKVVLNCLHNSRDNTVELLKEIESYLIMNNLNCEVHCHGIAKDPGTNNFIMVMNYDEFNKCYIKHGVCKECKQPNTGYFWCQPCNSQHFQQNFKNWTSEDHVIDEFIQNAQLKAKNYWNLLEWIDYNRFENVEYLAKSEFETTYKATWKDGYIFSWDSENNQWERYKEYYKKGQSAVLKCLHYSQDITDGFLSKIYSHHIMNGASCYGITKHPETNNFIIVFNMEEIKLSDDVFEQIKDFTYYSLTGEQISLIDKLILNEEFKKQYKEHGLCKQCKQPNTGNSDCYSNKYWCQSYNAKHFQQDFKNWTSGNHNIDEFIQNAQLNAKDDKAVLEWIDYDRFENVEYLTKGGFGTTYKAIWKDGYIGSWDSVNHQWERYDKAMVALKCLHDSQDSTVELLKEIESHFIKNNSNCQIHCYGFAKNPETNNFVIVMNYNEFSEYYIKHGLCKECKQPNTGSFWCQPCNSQHFQQNFKNWTSEDHVIDEFIQNAQLKAKNYWDLLEWIVYDRFENVEYLAKSEFEITYKATWKDGYIFSWDSENNQWERYKEYYKKGQSVVLKCLHYPQDITNEFLRKIYSHHIMNGVSCYGITKHPETNNIMIVLNMEEIKLSDDVIGQIKDFTYYILTDEQALLIDKLILNEEFKKQYKNYGLCEQCKQPNGSWCQSCNAKHFQQNFNNWTSGNNDINEFIQSAQLNAKGHREVLEWIDYDRFENVEYLAKGGFGTTYKAIWKDGYILNWNSVNYQWDRDDKAMVALKCLHDSQDIKVEFLREIKSHLAMNSATFVVTCFGITKDPETNNFIMVMDYAENGSLRQYLNNNFNSMVWKVKLAIIYRIAIGLEIIHNNRLIHQDFHCGNILNGNDYYSTYITDLGLCQPADVGLSQSGDRKIYGVLPYVAPEVLRGKEYTQASDVYGFGIIAYEVCSGLPPYHDIAHKELLAISICQGLRPKSNYKIPQLILDMIKQCWDANPLKRPKVKELVELLKKLEDDCDVKDSLIYKQCEEANEINIQSFSTSSLSHTNILSYATHPQAVYTSKLLDFKNLPEPKNAEPEYSESSMAIDFIQLEINSKDESN